MLALSRRLVPTPEQNVFSTLTSCLQFDIYQQSGMRLSQRLREPDHGSDGSFRINRVQINLLPEQVTRIA
jgi:hypothetical protein